jgi:hypothetical protein
MLRRVAPPEASIWSYDVTSACVGVRPEVISVRGGHTGHRVCREQFGENRDECTGQRLLCLLCSRFASGM